MTRALLVDDTTIVRESLPLLMPSIDFVAAYSHADALLADALPADLVVLDLHLANNAQPGVRQGVAAIQALADLGYRVCAYTQEERRFVLAACLAAGARGVVSKSDSVPATADAFHRVAAGEFVIPLPLVGLVELLARRRSVTIVSPRQLEVLAGRARGLTYAELSRRMHLSEATLRGYWADLCVTVSEYFRDASPGDLERELGVGPGDLVSHWPTPRTGRD